MSESQHLGHFVKHAANEVKKMKPLNENKNPSLAAILGFFFGPVGIGIYFGSLKDFFVCLVLLIILSIIIPGLGVLPGWLFSAGYGAYRASTSNDN